MYSFFFKELNLTFKKIFFFKLFKEPEVSFACHFTVSFHCDGTSLVPRRLYVGGAGPDFQGKTDSTANPVMSMIAQ